MPDPTHLTPGVQVLTNELIAGIAAERNGWSREQLRILGVPWPPPQGWRKQLVAEKRVLTDSVLDELREAQLGESTEATSLSATLQVTVGACLRVRRHRQREHDDIVLGSHQPEFSKPVRNWMVEDGWLSESEASDKKALADANQEILRRLADGTFTHTPKARTDD